MADDLVLECIDIRLRYRNGKEALKGVSLAIPAGSTHGLVGESGSGKSSLARVALMLERPTSGAVRFQGREISRLRERQVAPLRGDMQIVLQDPIAALNRSRSVGHAVELPLIVHTAMSGDERRARVTELLRLVGLSEDLAQRHPSELSGGQCQRVGIARALSLNPSLVVLDEAVSAVDVVTQAQILNLLKELQRDRGLTYLFVSHDLAVVRYMADTLTVLHDGIVEEQGEAETVFRETTNAYTRELMAAIPALSDDSENRGTA